MKPREKLLLGSVLLLIVVFFYYLITAVSSDGWDYFFKYLFGGTATLVSVGGVYIAYKLQKRSEKSQAARVLLLEIQNAEKTITQIKDLQGVSDFMSVLPTNSWQRYQHLFVSDFNQDQRELINSFYVASSLAEVAINRMKKYLPISSEEKIKLTQHKLLDLAEKYKTTTANLVSGSAYEQEKNAILDSLFFKEEKWFMPNGDWGKLHNYVQNIRYVTTTTAGDKLRQIGSLE